MNRYKTFDATGVAPGGRIFAGDLNAIQDLAAALVDLAQALSVGSLTVGESGLTWSRFGPGEMNLSGRMRTAGYVMALGGLYPGEFTTTQRNAIASGLRPGRLIIWNSTTGQFEYNAGTDGSPNWQPLFGLHGTTHGSAGSDPIPAGAISNAQLRNSGALSVIGRSANSAGAPADISATPGSGAVLRESASVIGFGQINGQAAIAAATITGDRLAPNTVTASQIDPAAFPSALPPGVIVPYAGASAPSGWLMCDGSVVTRSGANANLFAAIGTAYGAGDGSTTFGIPDMRGRTPVGVGTHTDVSSRGNSEGEVLANRRPKHKHASGGLGVGAGGAHDHGSVADHSHKYYEPGGTSSISYVPGGTGATFATGSNYRDTPDNSGSGHALGSVGDHTHGISGQVGPSTLAPTDSPAYLTVNYIIKL